jgi:hypothetical protein
MRPDSYMLGMVTFVVYNGKKPKKYLYHEDLAATIGIDLALY